MPVGGRGKHRAEEGRGVNSPGTGNKRGGDSEINCKGQKDNILSRIEMKFFFATLVPEETKKRGKGEEKRPRTKKREGREKTDRVPRLKGRARL